MIEGLDIQELPASGDFRAGDLRKCRKTTRSARLSETQLAWLHKLRS